MSNQVIVDIRHSSDDVVVLVEDNYGKTFLSYTPERYREFETVEQLLYVVSGEQAMHGSFYIDARDSSVVCETCNSVEVHGFYPPSDERHGEVFVYTNDDDVA